MRALSPSLQSEIAKRLGAILAQVIPFLNQEVSVSTIFPSLRVLTLFLSGGQFSLAVDIWGLSTVAMWRRGIKSEMDCGGSETGYCLPARPPGI